MPLTFTLPQMGPIGKGAIALVTREAAGEPALSEPGESDQDVKRSAFPDRIQV